MTEFLNVDQVIELHDIAAGPAPVLDMDTLTSAVMRPRAGFGQHDARDMADIEAEAFVIAAGDERLDRPYRREGSGMAGDQHDLGYDDLIGVGATSSGSGSRPVGRLRCRPPVITRSLAPCPARAHLRCRSLPGRRAVESLGEPVALAGGSAPHTVNR